MLFRSVSQSRYARNLVAVVEQLGVEANGRCADLQIAVVERRYRIEEYDGSETVMEPKDYSFID